MIKIVYTYHPKIRGGGALEEWPMDLLFFFFDFLLVVGEVVWRDSEGGDIKRGTRLLVAAVSGERGLIIYFVLC